MDHMVETDPSQRPEFAVDDPARLPITRAVLGSIVLATVFWMATEITTGWNALYVREPWHDDPYHGAVSFMLIIVPFWTALCLLRLPFCPPSQALSVKRALDLVRALRFQVVLIAATLTAEWVSVILGVHKDVWNLTTACLVAVLAGLSVVTAVVAGWLHRALGSFQRFTSVPSQPDWIADVLELGERIAAHLGPGRRLATRSLRLLDRFVATPLRIHPLWTTGGLSLLGGTLVALPQIILEDYPATLALDLIAICATSLFAFLVIVGAKLQIPEPHHRRPSAGSYAVLLASLAVPLAAIFRTAIWTAVGVSADDQKVGGFTVLVLGAGLVVGIPVFLADSLLRRLHPSP
jgi:hypothetical protein